jgi:hypothetical protein
MKPFDLEKAKAGVPLITRDGRPVVWGAYNPNAVPGEAIVGWVDGAMLTYYENGNYYSDTASENDLFIAPIKRTVWVVVYKLSKNGPVTSMVFTNGVDMNFEKQMEGTTVLTVLTCEVEE